MHSEQGLGPIDPIDPKGLGPRGLESNVQVLQQSLLYFLPADWPIFGSSAIERFGQRFGRLQQARSGDVCLRLWQPGLGLLLALQLQQQEALIADLLSQKQQVQHWYQRDFLAQTSLALCFTGSRPTVAQLQSRAFPWKLPRFSPQAKQLLLLRLQGLRYSCSELLLFLCFAPLASLLAPASEPAKDEPGESLAKSASLASGLAVERAPGMAEILHLLDYHIYDIFGGGQSECYLQDMLSAEFRQGLRQLWQTEFSQLFQQQCRRKYRRKYRRK